MIYYGISLLIQLCVCYYTRGNGPHCITVCGKWIFDSNLKLALPLAQVCLNCICCGNDTDKNKFIGVLHAIREVPPEVVQII